VEEAKVVQNKGKTKDQLDKLQDRKDPKTTVLKVKLQGHKGQLKGPEDLPVKLQEHKDPLIKLQGHKDPQRGLQEAKIAEVKEVKEDLKVKLPGHKGQLKGPKDLKLKVKLQDHNKRPTKGHHKDPSNSLMQLTGEVEADLVLVEPWKCVLMFVLHFLLVYSEPVWPDVRNGVPQRNKNPGLI